MKKIKGKFVTEEEKLELARKRSYEERIVFLLKMIRLSNLVSEAGARYRKGK